MVSRRSLLYSRPHVNTIDTPGTLTAAKARRRLIPFLFLLYVVSYLDRINVGFAALQMNRELGFSAAVYGLGAGVFFIAYVLFEVPSNLALDRVGVRFWIARIMITWGVVSSAMMFVKGPTSFYALRFLLGAAEAGFFPGIILYLTRWFPAEERAHAVAWFMTATALAGVIGAPLSGTLLALDGVRGLGGWQWLFLLEGVPAVALGIAVPFYLPERPADARWLTPAERALMTARVAADLEAARANGTHEIGAAFRSGRVWLLGTVYFCLVLALYGIGFWLPQIVQALSGLPTFGVAMVSALPYAAAAVTMVPIGRRADRSGDHGRWVAGCAAVGSAAFLTAAAVRGPVPSLAAISLAAVGIWGTFGPFWSLPASFLSGPAAAAGIALVNSIGNVGGFVGPYLVGYVREATGSFAAGLVVLGLALAAAAALALAARASAGR